MKKGLSWIMLVVGVLVWALWSVIIGAIVAFIGLFLLKFVYEANAKKIYWGEFFIVGGLLYPLGSNINLFVFLFDLLIGITLYTWGMVQSAGKEGVEVKEKAPEKIDIKPDMKKFVCEKCGEVFGGWYNECPKCGAVGKMRKGTYEEILTWNGIQDANQTKKTLTPENNNFPEDTRIKYVCNGCGAFQTGWYQKCPKCGEIRKMRKFR